MRDVGQDMTSEDVPSDSPDLRCAELLLPWRHIIHPPERAHTLKEIVCDHFGVGTSSHSPLNLRERFPCNRRTDVNLTGGRDRQFSQLSGWLSPSGRQHLPAALGIWASFHSKRRWTFVQQFEDELVFSWEGHRPLVAQMKQLITANSELEAKAEEKQHVLLKHSSSRWFFPPFCSSFSLWLWVLCCLSKAK